MRESTERMASALFEHYDQTKAARKHSLKNYPQIVIALVFRMHCDFYRYYNVEDDDDDDELTYEFLHAKFAYQFMEKRSAYRQFQQIEMDCVCQPWFIIPFGSLLALRTLKH